MKIVTLEQTVKTKTILCLALVLSCASWNVRAAESYEPSTNFLGLVLNIRCASPVLKLGDEIPILFVISNSGVANYSFGDRTTGSGDCMWEYRLIVKSANLHTTPDPRALIPNLNNSGFGYHTRVLRPGETFEKAFSLNLWAVIAHPGQYTVTGTYFGGDDGRMQVQATPLNLTVLPRTELEMNAYISDLEKQLAGINGTDRDARNSILVKLAFTGSPKIVPFMLKAMYASDDNYWPAQALMVYVPHSDATRKEIVGMALQHGLAECMDDVLHQYGCTKEEWQAILKQSLAEATTHLFVGNIAQIYHLDVDNPRAEDRARLAHDFPKLKPDSQLFVLRSLWPRARCPELVDALVPLAKLPIKPEQYFDDTLCDHVFLHLLDLKPEAVRPMILEDLHRPNPLLAPCVLQALPEKELPELDDVLIINLNNPNCDLMKIAPLITRYATGRILPQVIEFYKRHEGGWSCSIQATILRYWLKYDRPAALQAVEKAVSFRKSTGCFKTVLGGTLHDSFDADAEKLARKFANDPDPEVAADARKLLAEHALTPHSKQP